MIVEVADGEREPRLDEMVKEPVVRFKVVLQRDHSPPRGSAHRSEALADDLQLLERVVLAVTNNAAPQLIGEVESLGGRVGLDCRRR